ncbi:WalW protein [Sphingomonas sp. S2-65]|uniref:WalW protein n=1 Tax=Sphingomonas sp. S2-65 TaxID=2903960 RepID=UPI001F425699|nr:WalW protein [Sphingomonas sp. S2-65]UYY59071.1 WalW protein [Sphingomonas sp. S2-65]
MAERQLPYRVPAPEPHALLHWPDAFGTRFTVFIDTEEEFDWTKPFSRDARGTNHMRALPAAHAWFTARGVPLTCLIDHPIATCARSVEILRTMLEDGRSAVGTQLHPWVSPPFDEDVSILNSFAANLPHGLEEAKLTLLTTLITDAIGVQPRIYRAGRYGIGPDTPAMLSRLGYRLDSSMRAGYDYSRAGGPDFTRIGNQPFGLMPGLSELPLTTVYTGHARRGGAGLHRWLGTLPRGRGIASRLGLFSRVALTPEDMPLDDVLEAVRVAAGEGVRLLNFSFHSPSLEPGHTPYVRTEADLAAFYRWWEGVLAELDRLKIAPASLDQIIDALDAACGPTATSASAGSAGGL